MNVKASLGFVTSTAVFAILSGFLPQSVRANHLDFTLYNESSQSIHYLYVSPARSDDWGDNILNNTLRSGGYTRITFPNQNNDSPCIYDIAVIFSDRRVSKSRVNLCESSSVTAR